VNFSLRAQVREAKKLGQYHLEEKIGEGGMGTVYRATHAMLRRPTAIKLLRPEITGEETIRRFEREVQQTSRLSHPNTVAIYDYGRTPDGVFYYAMELLGGADLDRLVRAHGPFPAARAIHVLRQACGALAEAHGAGLVHRDIKPGNIILCERGGVHDVAKVVDFGLVRDLRNVQGSLTRVGTICGTPETIAPEVLSGSEAGPAADLYALGVVGCFLLTGKPIFDVTTAGELIGAHLHSDPVPPSARDPSVPRDLEAALLRCLAKDPARRVPTAEALRADLAACAAAGRWTDEDAQRWWHDHPRAPSGS
jgi:serine/threonine-protein kinase